MKVRTHLSVILLCSIVLIGNAPALHAQKVKPPLPLTIAPVKDNL